MFVFCRSQSFHLISAYDLLSNYASMGIACTYKTKKMKLKKRIHLNCNAYDADSIIDSHIIGFVAYRYKTAYTGTQRTHLSCPNWSH